MLWPWIVGGQHTIERCRLTDQGVPVVTVSNGQSYVYHADLSSWWILILVKFSFWTWLKFFCLVYRTTRADSNGAYVIMTWCVKILFYLASVDAYVIWLLCCVPGWLCHHLIIRFTNAPTTKPVLRDQHQRVVVSCPNCKLEHVRGNTDNLSSSPAKIISWIL